MPGHELFRKTDEVEIYFYINQFQLTTFYEVEIQIFVFEEEFILQELRCDFFRKTLKIGILAKIRCYE